MAAYRYVVADVFTSTPLTGNQLAVFTDARGLDTETMQALTLEIGFSETVFVLPPEQGGTARIRIFNPKEEMPFAGHPILGTAFVLAAPLQHGVVELETGAGLVPVSLDRDEQGALVFGRMSQPVPTVERVDEAPVLAALGVGASELPVELYDNGARHIVVMLPDVSAVSALAPDLAAVGALGVTGLNAVAGAGERWRSRSPRPRRSPRTSGSATARRPRRPR